MSGRILAEKVSCFRLARYPRTIRKVALRFVNPSRQVIRNPTFRVADGSLIGLNRV